MPPPRLRSLDEWLRFQETLSPRAIALGLERVRAVAARLGLPTRREAGGAYTLTVAGTNGKGSSATLAAAIYRAAGYRVGLYTSPHVLRYNERVQIDGAAVGDAALCEAFTAIDAARGEVALTYFEFGTLAALWLFRRARVDVQVLEVGLGGRLDAVNLIDADVALLTNVGLDHQDWLGDDREQIGREKAGVFRGGHVAVIAEREPPASVLAAADGFGARALRLGADFDYVVLPDGSWSWRLRAETWTRLPPPALAGAVQYQNAAGVFAAVHAGLALRPLRRDDCERGLAQLHLRGRCETYRGVLLDVAHNLESAQALAGFLAAQPPAPTVVVLGMLADKPVEAVGRVLAAAATRVLAVGLGGPRGLDAAALQARLADAGVRAETCENIGAALAQARREAGAGGRVVVTGSFLTVAAALNELERSPDAHG
ncbi:bifunctional folylpolyglutamate synthase/dihydrofolate synthase [Solimonas flava]|uniref:bifunctional folylpolyglutamate synthase/dihydrofolate synthase n=1 Tax=Solimonas flava TaxID=415849 RepID=UPI000426664B|nr:folylpolyglutamate synthase/dihydrofolate synthase family protein [Solimonas flava]